MRLLTSPHVLFAAFAGNNARATDDFNSITRYANLILDAKCPSQSSALLSTCSCPTGAPPRSVALHVPDAECYYCRALWARRGWPPARVATRGQATKYPWQSKIIHEALNHVLNHHTRCVQGPRHGTRTGACDHVNVNAILLEYLQYTEIGHAAGGASTEGDSNRDAAKMMDDTLDPTL